MNFDQYRAVPYVSGGRVLVTGLDCWGLVRHVLHHEFCHPLLDDFGLVQPRQYRCMTEGYRKSRALFEVCKPFAGALACCFQVGADGKDIFHHVGICISDNEVLHTSSKKGPQVMRVRDFKRVAKKVEFYCYVG
ncbi:MAG: hypothetical protein RPT11_02865 [Bermanella sp.]